MVSPSTVLHEDELNKLPVRWWAIMLRGLLGILLGIVVFFMPVATLLALVYLFGAYAFFDGVFNLIAAWRHTNLQQKPWWALLLSGIAGIGAAVISFVWPGITALALVYVVSAWAIITGGLEIAAAVKLRTSLPSFQMRARLGWSGISAPMLLCSAS